MSLCSSDKAGHFIAGFVISLITGAISCAYIGMAVGIAAGIVKELLDFAGFGTAEFNDFLATTIGSVIGALVVVMLL